MELYISICKTLTQLTFIANFLFFCSDKSDGKNLLHRLKSVDEIIRVLLTVYFMFLVGNMIVSTPENHMSSGIHQTVGDCKIFQNDLAGHQRQVKMG